jgi:hypothetical protein
VMVPDGASDLNQKIQNLRFYQNYETVDSRFSKYVCFYVHYSKNLELQEIFVHASAEITDRAFNNKRSFVSIIGLYMYLYICFHSNIIS